MRFIDLFTGKFFEEFKELCNDVVEIRNRQNRNTADIRTLENYRDAYRDKFDRQGERIATLERRVETLSDYFDAAINKIKELDYQSVKKKDWRTRFPVIKELPADFFEDHAKNEELVTMLNICKTRINEYKRAGWFRGFRCGKNIYYDLDSIAEFLEKHERNEKGNGWIEK